MWDKDNQNINPRPSISPIAPDMGDTPSHLH
jgi:hypothetical protein